MTKNRAHGFRQETHISPLQPPVDVDVICSQMKVLLMPVLGTTLITVYVSCSCLSLQWRSQNAEKVTHIKGILLDQAVLLFKCVPFQGGNFSRILSLRVVPY